MRNNLAFGPSANLLSGGSAAEKATRYRNTWMYERVHKRKYRSMAKERRKQNIRDKMAGFKDETETPLLLQMP